MITPAFSTVACPELTLDQIAPLCRGWGFPGIELRTFGDGGRGLASDPALISAEKVRRLFHEAGTKVTSLATSVAFDAPIRPPVLGNAISDTQVSVRAAKRAIDLAISIECPLVRVFGFEVRFGEPRKTAIARIVSRLKSVVDHAHRTGVKVMLENGGSFSAASEVLEIVEQVASPLLGVCYNVALGQSVGESPATALGAIGDRLFALRIKDLRDGKPVALGEGEVDWKSAVRLASARGVDLPVIYEWDRAWLAGLAPAAQVLPGAARLLLTEADVGGGKQPSGAARQAASV